MDELGYRANYEEYPSFDDQGSHLSRNPSASANATAANNNNNNNNGTMSSQTNSTGGLISSSTTSSSNNHNHHHHHHQSADNTGLMVKNPIANPNMINYSQQQNASTTIGHTVLGLSSDYNEQLLASSSNNKSNF